LSPEQEKVGAGRFLFSLGVPVEKEEEVGREKRYC